MSRLLIVNADDLGLHRDINRGIHLAHTQGIVTSCSVVPCGEAFQDAAKILQECPELDVGVHLTLVEERPLCPPEDVPSLVGAHGRFLPTYRAFTARALTGRVSPGEVRRELRAQIERVLAIGRRPSHLDSHQHVHLLPPVWRVVRELASDYGIRWVRVPRFSSLVQFRKSAYDPIFRLGLNVLSALRGPRDVGASNGVRTVGLHLSGRLGERDVHGILQGLQPGLTELITHPAMATPGLQARYRWGYDWSSELDAVTSPRVIATLRSKGIRLARFCEC